MKTIAIKSIEYWFDWMTSCYQVTKKDYYNSYLNFSKFRVITLVDNTKFYHI